MRIDCDVRIEREEPETVWVRWELRQHPGAVTFASGLVAYDLETVQFHWEHGRPPAEHEFLVRTTIDRTIRARPRAG